MIEIRATKRGAETLLISEADDVLAYLLCMQPERKVRSLNDIDQAYFGLVGEGRWLICARGNAALWADAQVPGIRVRAVDQAC